jgi:hypothetical protein
MKNVTDVSDVKLEDAVIAWSAEEGEPWFRVIDRKSYRGRPGAYRDGGAVYGNWRKLETAERLLNLFGEVMSAMARDGIPFGKVHAELLKIPEYRRQVIAVDTPGAEGENTDMLNIGRL